MVIKCNYCNSKVNKKTYVFTSNKINPRTGRSIEVKDASYLECPECAHTWMTEEQEAYLESEVSKQSRHQMTPDQIRLLREGLPFKTKRAVADFLCFNGKAFSHWENGTSAPNDAYDLLLRLAARSQDNLDFISYLHSKSFAFNIEDYAVVKTSFVVASQLGKIEESKLMETQPSGYFKTSVAKADKGPLPTAGNDYAMVA